MWISFKQYLSHKNDGFTDVFDGFKNDGGEFKESLGGDTEGVLQLYEASFLFK